MGPFGIQGAAKTRSKSKVYLSTEGWGEGSPYGGKEKWGPSLNDRASLRGGGEGGCRRTRIRGLSYELRGGKAEPAQQRYLGGEGKVCLQVSRERGKGF